MSGALCISCAMCCDGTLFDVVAVSAAERDRLGGGADFAEVDGRLTMRQPCARLGRDGVCGVYARRPAQCGVYDCDLLRAVAAGKVTETAALARVREAHVLRRKAHAALDAAMPDGSVDGQSPTKRMQHLQDAVDEGRSIPPEDFNQAKSAFMAFAVHLAAHFRDPTGGRTG